MSAFGQLLRRHRRTAEFSQQELAEKAQLSTAAVGALERGLRRAPRSETIALLAEALNLSAPARAELEEAAKRGRARFATPVETGAKRGRTPALPPATTTFVGRDAESAALRAMLLERGRRFVTITGSGGVGKSRLALETLRALASEFEDGVHLVRLARVAEPEAVAFALVDELGLSDRGDRRPIELVEHALRDRNALLVLDNCEHQLEAVAEVVQVLLAACPGVSLLVTSRERLRLAGEVTFDLAALAYPSTHTAAPAETMQYPAIRLFLERANALSERPFEFDASGLRAICEIVRELDGLPLAIELAVPTLRVLDVTELAKRLQDRFRLLSVGERDALPHHRSLRALIDWSYERLTSEERAVFAACSIFAGSFSLAAVVAMCAGRSLPEGDVIAIFATLVEKSLVRVVDRAAGRYDLSSLIREYAAGTVCDRVEREALSLRHASYYLQLARDINAQGERIPSEERFGLTKREAPNFEAALHWALTERGEPETGAHLALALNWFFFYDSHLRSRHWFETALAALNWETFPALAARLTLEVACFNQTSAGIANLIPDLERAVAFHRAQAPSWEAVQASSWLAYALASAGRAREARTAAAESVALARVCVGPRELAWTLRNHSAIMLRDDLEQQRVLLEESFRVQIGASDAAKASEVLSALGQVEFFSGNCDAAIAYTRRAIEASRAALPTNGTMTAAQLGNIAAYSLSRGDVAAGIEIAREALELSLQSGDARRAATLLGFVRARTGAMNDVALCLENYVAERLEELLAAALLESERSALIRAGSSWSEDRACEEALAVR